MKALFLLISLCFTLTLTAKDLSDHEAQALKQEIEVMMDKFNKGDTTDISSKTHSSLIKLIGGREKFAETLQNAAETMVKEGVRFTKVELGKPSEVHLAGNEEVVFVPRVSFISVKDKKLKSTGFMVAIRTVNTAKWTYLDGAGLARKKDLLWTLLPKLSKDVKLPENSMLILPNEEESAE